MQVEQQSDFAADEAEIFDTLGISPHTGDTGEAAQEGAQAPAESGGEVAAPSAPPVTPPEGESPPEPAAPEPAIAPVPQPQAAPTAPAPQPAEPTPPADDKLRTASLEAQVEALQRALQQQQANPQQGQQPQAVESGQQPVPIAPTRYGLTLPQPVQEALLSEDPQKNVQAITAIMNDLGTIVHNNVAMQLRGEVSKMFQSLVYAASEGEQMQVRATGRESAQKQYYDAFPSHKNPTVLPLIQAESQKMAAEFPGLSWSQDYVNALGARVEATIRQLSGQPPIQQGQQPAPRPAPGLPSGQRAPVQFGDNAAGGSDLIEDTLGVF